MRAIDIMSRPVHTVHPWTPVSEAAASLTERAVTALPVVDEEDRLVGIISEGDLLWQRTPKDPDAHLARGPDGGVDDPPGTVGDVMTTAVVAMPTGASTAELARVMIDYDIHSVPIVSDDEVVGIVSRRDLLRTLIRRDHVIALTVRRNLDEYSGHLQRWEVGVADGVVTVTGSFIDPAEQAVVRILVKSVDGVKAVHLKPANSPAAAGPAQTG